MVMHVVVLGWSCGDACGCVGVVHVMVLWWCCGGAVVVL